MKNEALSKWTIVAAVNKRPALIPPTRWRLDSVICCQPSSKPGLFGLPIQHGGRGSLLQRF